MIDMYIKAEYTLKAFRLGLKKQAQGNHFNYTVMYFLLTNYKNYRTVVILIVHTPFTPLTHSGMSPNLNPSIQFN